MSKQKKKKEKLKMLRTIGEKLKFQKTVILQKEIIVPYTGIHFFCHGQFWE